MSDAEALKQWGPFLGLFVLLVLGLLIQNRRFTAEAAKREQEAAKRENLRLIESQTREAAMSKALDEQRDFVAQTLLTQLQNNTKTTAEHTEALRGLTDALRGVSCLNAVHDGNGQRPPVS